MFLSTHASTLIKFYLSWKKKQTSKWKRFLTKSKGCKDVCLVMKKSTTGPQCFLKIVWSLIVKKYFNLCTLWHGSVVDFFITKQTFLHPFRNLFHLLWLYSHRAYIKIIVVGVANNHCLNQSCPHRHLYGYGQDMWIMTHTCINELHVCYSETLQLLWRA